MEACGGGGRTALLCEAEARCRELSSSGWPSHLGGGDTLHIHPQRPLVEEEVEEALGLQLLPLGGGGREGHVVGEGHLRPAKGVVAARSREIAGRWVSNRHVHAWQPGSGWWQ